MKALLIPLFLVGAACGEEPSFVFDNRPEDGLPRDAVAQIESEMSPTRAGAEAKRAELRARLSTHERRLFDQGEIKLHEFTEGTIKTARIRYFDKDTWKTKEQAREYVRGFLAHRSLETFVSPPWPQSVQVPELECLIDFTGEHLQKLREEGIPAERERRLLIWHSVACFRSATGRWWFVSAFDHFHAAHPKGDRKLAKEPNANASDRASDREQVPQVADSPGRWVTSDDGKLSIRLSVKSPRIAAKENISLIARIRNNETRPVTILRPFGELEAEGFYLKIWGEDGRMKYTGPEFDYDLDARAFITLGPGEIVTDTLKISNDFFAGLDRAGSYTLRFDYRYDGTWDAKVAREGVKDIWRGWICTREVSVERK